MLSNGTGVRVLGRATVSVPSFSLIYFSFYTKNHTFPLWIGESLVWFGGSVSLAGVDGVMYPQQGDQRPCSNANVSTITSPRLSSFELSFNPTLAEVQATFHTETTTLLVVDSTGSSVVGASSQDLVTISWAPDKSLKATLLVGLTVALAMTPLVTARRQERRVSIRVSAAESASEKVIENSAGPPPPRVHGPRLRNDQRVPVLLGEAGEAMRSDNERLWRSQEFYAGAIVTSLGAAAAAFGLVPSVSVVSFILATLGVFLAGMGLMILDREAYCFVRDELVWKRLLWLQAGAQGPARSLELEAKMLTTSVEDLSATPATELDELLRAGLIPEPDKIWAFTGVARTFRGILLLLGLVAAGAASLFLILTYAREPFSTYNLAVWIFASVSAPLIVVAGLIPGWAVAKALRMARQKAVAEG